MCLGVVMEYVCIGGSSGIGRAVVEKLASEGHTVHVASRSSKELTASPNVTHSVFDVESGEGTLPEVSSLAGFAYFPGTISLKPFPSMSCDDFSHDFALNVLGAIRPLQKYIEALKHGNGSIVLMSSVAVQMGFPYHASIAAAKGALEGLMRSLAAEYAPTVRCNCVAPSLTETPLSESLLGSEEKKASMGKRHPLARIGSVDDISHLVHYLLSENSKWVTGHVFPVDGGISSVRGAG